MMEIDLRTASAADVPALRRNWKLCFGDDDAYLDFFFANRFLPDDTPVLTQDGEVVSQLFLLPASIRDAAGETHPAYYLFAAATHPQYRARGYMARLLDFARDLSVQRGKCGIALQPGDKSLYDYYAKFGYRKSFKRRVWMCDLCGADTVSVPKQFDADAAQALLLNQQTRPGLCWDREALTFAVEEHRRFRGRCAAWKNVYVSEEDGVCRIISVPDDLPAGVALLRAVTEETHDPVRVILPPDAPAGKPEDGGMFLPLKPIELGEAFLSFAKE